MSNGRGDPVISYEHEMKAEISRHPGGAEGLSLPRGAVTATLKKGKDYLNPRGRSSQPGNAELYPSTAGGPVAAGGTLLEVNWHKAEQKRAFLSPKC